MNKLNLALTKGPIALYLHVPFCETKCPYCDFNTYARIETLIPSYVNALRKEIENWGNILDHPKVTTIFFGGGTPSYLPPDDIYSILDTVSLTFDTSNLTETTLESNPGDITEPRLAAYMQFGVNRLSIGVQSFNDRLLKLLGRRHSAAEAVESDRLAARSGFENISIDLMYGLPYQSLTDWYQTLELAVEIQPAHLSMYCLTLEPGTPMEQLIRSKQLPEPDTDLSADMYLAAEDAMVKPGYQHYEISNWAQPGRRSYHNLIYWHNEAFLGIGPGAHSYLSGYRFHNINSPREYIKRVSEFSHLSSTMSQQKKKYFALDKIPVIVQLKR